MKLSKAQKAQVAEMLRKKIDALETRKYRHNFMHEQELYELESELGYYEQCLRKLGSM